MLHQEDKLIVCPYNPAHLIRGKRMQYHLAKCRKNYPTQEFQICPMDTTHHIPKQEFQYHLETCPKRYVIDSAFCVTKSEKESVVPLLPLATVKAMLPESDECWDDISVPSYDPQTVSAKRNVIRVLKNAPPAVKRQFQIEERRRLIQLQDEARATGPIEEIHSTSAGENLVRMPKNQPQTITVQRQTQNQ